MISADGLTGAVREHVDVQLVIFLDGKGLLRGALLHKNVWAESSCIAQIVGSGLKELYGTYTRQTLDNVHGHASC